MKRFWIGPVSWLPLVVVLGSVSAHAASFDCKLAKTPQERAICSSAELSKLDSELGAAYKTMLARVDAQAGAALRADEADWLRFLAVECKAAKPQPLPTLATCMAEHYQDRVERLQKPMTTVAGVVFITRTKSFTAPILPPDRLPSDDTDSTTLQANWPQALSPDPAWKAWNAAVEEQVKEMSRPEEEHGTAWSAAWAKDSDTDVSATIQYVDDRLITTHIENDFMGHGAAHPGEAWLSFHWLRKEGRTLRVQDVFRPNSGWQAVIARHCRQGLQAQWDANGEGNGGYGGKMEADALRLVIASPQNWILDETGLTISFPEYSVAPRVSMPDPVTVPWAALKPFLAAGFLIPHGKADQVGGQAGG